LVLLCWQFDSLVACAEDGSTATFANSAQHEFTALITRTDPGSSARCARFGHSGRKIAVASDELLVKVIDVRDTTEIQLLSGHSKGVRALGWNPDGTILVSASTDGTVRVWDMSAAEPVCIKTLDGLIPVADAE
jgi:chromosome transmission fidelity protein 4